MSVAWCHSFSTNPEDRLEHRKGGCPWYSVSTGKKCHVFFPHLCLGISKMELLSFFFDINVITNEGLLTTSTGE